MKNERLEIDHSLASYISEKDRAGCRGWLQYRIQRMHDPNDFDSLIRRIDAQGASWIWDEFDDSSLPSMKDSRDEWTEEYLSVVLTTLKFNFSERRFRHAIEVACALRPERGPVSEGSGVLNIFKRLAHDLRIELEDAKHNYR